MEEFNLFLGILGGISSLISIIQIIIHSEKKLISTLVLSISLLVIFLVPILPSEKEIVQYGPNFFTVSESEFKKIGYTLVTNPNKPIIIDRSIPNMPSKVKIVAKAVIWSQHDETASISIFFSNLQGCSRKSELIFSKRLSSSINAEDYRDPSRMEEKSETIILGCNPPIKELSLTVIPGTWALSVNSIKIIGISKVNLPMYIKNHLFN